MSKKHNQEVDTNIESLSKAEAFITKNSKKLLSAVAVVLVVVIGILSARSCSEKKDAEGQVAFTSVEKAVLMATDSLGYATALAELESYIAEHGSHAAGAAAFEAGVTAFQAKDYNKAIEFFSEYEGEDDIYNARALACIADCYVELGNYEKAYENYAAALAKADNELSAEYAFRAGLVAEKLGQNDKALAMYETIKNNYPASPRAGQIEKYISRVEAK
jgi:tetratricopeptide (TPR) repeat protein